MSEDKEKSIMVPLDDVPSDDVPDTADQLAHELATIQKSSKRIAIIGSRNLPITHQQIIETLAFVLASQGNVTFSYTLLTLPPMFHF